MTPAEELQAELEEAHTGPFQLTYIDEDGTLRCTKHRAAFYPMEGEDSDEECPDCYYEGDGR